MPQPTGRGGERTLWESAPGQPATIDQTRLPFERREILLDSLDRCAHAIRTMQVRGAPLIGATAAWGMAMAMRENDSDTHLHEAAELLMATRPTAVNLRWALERVVSGLTPLPAPDRAAAALEMARTVCEDDIACNRQIGEHAAPLLLQHKKPDRPLQVLTHCNAGRIATVAWGTALSPVYQLAQSNTELHVWVDETRPRNQGGSLTAWELSDGNIAHTIIADNAAGLMMMRGEVDVVIVGCDRLAANGDVVNKIGTYSTALAAAAHNIPFYVALPTSTIDPRCPDGPSVPIENRDDTEVTHMLGQLENGELARVRITSPGSAVANPAFDITPAALVTQIITERGCCDASTSAIAALGLT
jgi:methylthioribose-1-phosphate isomerase